MFLNCVIHFKQPRADEQHLRQFLHLDDIWQLALCKCKHDTQKKKSWQDKKNHKETDRVYAWA